MTVFTKNIDYLLSSGFFNKQHSNWFFTKKGALEKLEILIEKKYPILGGEIYDDSFRLIWSWSCDKKQLEEEEHYLNRSKEIAVENIKDTEWLEGAKYFSFIPTLLSV